MRLSFMDRIAVVRKRSRHSLWGGKRAAGTVERFVQARKAIRGRRQCTEHAAWIIDGLCDGHDDSTYLAGCS